MLRRMSVVLILIGCLVTLSACGNGLYSHGTFKKLSPEKRCALIKRQMLYNDNNHNTEARWLARSQRQDLENIFEANDCENVLKH